MNFKRLAVLGLLSTSTLAMHASTHVGVGISIGMPAPIIVRQAPPRPVSEVVIVSPGPGHVWVPGHYSWNSNQWVWIAGAWVVPPQPGAYWVEGRWDGPTQSWTEGHWEVAQVANAPAQPTSPPPAVVMPATPAPAVSTQVVITAPPPPVRIEHRGHRPGRGYVWTSGYWVYRGNHYAWVPGRWIRPPHGHRVWVEPRWERRGSTWIFIEGSWR